MKIIALLAAAVAATIFAGCSNNTPAEQETPTRTTIETRAGERNLLSAEEANALASDLLKNNTFIDVDFDIIDVHNINLETPIEEVVKCKVALNRLYSNVGMKKQRYYIKKSAAEMNLSKATYAHFETMIAQLNSYIEEDLAAGKTFEEIMAGAPDFANSTAANLDNPDFF